MTRALSSHLTAVLLLTLCFLFTKEALGHFSEEFLGRTWGMELWHHYTAAGGNLVGGETLREAKKKKKEDSEVEGEKMYELEDHTPRISTDILSSSPVQLTK